MLVKTVNLLWVSLTVSPCLLFRWKLFSEKKLIWYALGRSISNEGSYKKFKMIKLSVCMLHKYLNIVGDSMFLKGIFRLLVQVLNV